MFAQFTGQQMMRNPNRMIQFFKELRVYPASFAFREDIEIGDKILLPASCLQELYGLIHGRNRDPMVFCLKNANRLTYCGVLQFVADQGLCYVPNWMFRMLKFKQPGQSATITLVPDMKKKNSKEAFFIKLRPHLTKFIELQNPKAVLQYQLRNFTCLHEGDTITITTYSGKFEIDILEIRPKNDYDAICIIDTDVNVDFAPPLDYEEPTNTNQGKVIEKMQGEKTNGPFSGLGVRIDEKANKNNARKASQQIQEEEQYDPRKHRIHRGVRKISQDWIGDGVKIGHAAGTRR